MAAAYCGTLALECQHLQQQDEISWMQERFESRKPLTKSQKRQVSNTSLQAPCYSRLLVMLIGPAELLRLRCSGHGPADAAP
jgi:2-oxoglutarate dehydrogenase complex dehydrogenase (E1) component-like enzyme